MQNVKHVLGVAVIAYVVIAATTRVSMLRSLAGL
jgi:hypothetical protein